MFGRLRGEDSDFSTLIDYVDQSHQGCLASQLTAGCAVFDVVAGHEPEEATRVALAAGDENLRCDRLRIGAALARRSSSIGITESSGPAKRMVGKSHLPLVSTGPDYEVKLCRNLASQPDGTQLDRFLRNRTVDGNTRCCRVSRFIKTLGHSILAEIVVEDV